MPEEQGTLTIVMDKVIDIAAGGGGGGGDDPARVDDLTEQVAAKPAGDDAAAAEAKAAEDEAKAEADAKAAEEAKAKPDKTPTAEEKAYITREKNRRKAIEEQNALLMQQIAQQQAIIDRFVPKPGDAPEPARDQYGDPDQYLEARAQWLADRKLAARETERQQQELRRNSEKIEAEYDKRLAAAEAKFPGISEIGRGKDLSFVAMVNDAMAATIKQSDIAPEILNYLNENRDETARIFSLNPARAAAEIGKLEAKLTAPEPVPNPLPRPMSPLNGSGRAVTKTETDPDLTDAEYFEMEKAKDRARLAEMKQMVYGRGLGTR